MDYEQFTGGYQEIAETLKTQIANQQKLLRRVNKYVGSGDVKSALRDIGALADMTKNSADTINGMTEYVGAADMPAYLLSGEFAAQLLEACRAAGIDIVGEGTGFEVFPYRLRLNPDDAELLINGRKAAGLRPAMIAETLAKSRDKLLAANFNPTLFLDELAAAYDLAIAVAAKGKAVSAEQDILLSTIYKYLTPMRRFRRDYDAQSYAFDLSRLYSTLSEQTSDGRFFQFGPSRQNYRAIRIVDEAGIERFLATIRFFRK